MKNALHFTFHLFVLKIFKFLPWILGQVVKGLDKEDQIDFKFYDVTTWLINSHKTYITKYLEK